MLTPTQMRWTLRAIAVAGLALALAFAAVPKADAARSWATVPPIESASYAPTVPVQRVGLNCQNTEYLIWGVRYCVTIRARKDRLGQWWFQPAAAISGWNAQGRRKMRFLTAVRMGGHTTSAAGKSRRLVVRGPWRLGDNRPDDVRAVFVFRWPNGRKSAVKLQPHA